MNNSKISILVVEDDKFISNAYKIKLNSEGYQVKNAYNGVEAIEMLKNFYPDLIILDLVMPIKNGFEVLKDLKKNKKLLSIPIIVATNLGEDQYIVKAKEMGATDYILKSEMSLDDLVKKIKSLLKVAI